MAIALTGSKKFELLGEAKDTFTYLEKNDRGKIVETAKAFDADRDFKMALLCHNLISNIICTRRKYYHDISGHLYVFDSVDLSSLTATESTLIKISLPVV